MTERLSLARNNRYNHHTASRGVEAVMGLGILLVDPQLDFFPGGALGVNDGDAIVAPINTLLLRYPQAAVFASRDMHPNNTKHFQARGGVWPPHCVAGTRGASFHPDLRLNAAVVVDKGTDPENDAGYSAFEGQKDGVTLDALLRQRGVDTLIVAGLATDYCVKASALDAIKHGYVTLLFEPGVRAVNLKPDDGAAAIAVMREQGVLCVH